MNRKFTALLAFVSLLGFLGAGSLQAALSPAGLNFVRNFGPSYGLSSDVKGNVVYAPMGPLTANSSRARLLNDTGVSKINFLSEKIGDKNPDVELVTQLRTLLTPTMGDAAVLNGQPLYQKMKDGTVSLTPFGRTILMDFLTATDGDGLIDRRMGLEQSQPAKMVSKNALLARLKMEGHLVYLDEKNANLTMDKAQSAFDRSQRLVPQIVYPMQAYKKWNSLEKGKTENVFVDPKNGNLRLIVAAKSSAKIDRYKLLNGNEAESLYKETGLNRALIEKHGGRALRVVDNLVEVEVSRRQAAALGRALEGEGISSAPSLKVTMDYAAAQGAARAGGLLGRLSPFPKALLGRIADKFRPLSNVAGDLMKTEGLWKRGMDGHGATVAIIDSGLDMKHPDFKDRVLAYIDLAQGGVDAIGHGSHVAGLTGGDGSASNGLYKGMAPKAKFVVIQVFSDMAQGASEYAILGAMKIAASLPGNLKADVVNMSLGIAPPMGSNLHSTALLADYAMVRNNMFMSIAAGNSGPKQYTIGSPGNARHVLTVTGTNKNKEFPYFPSRGPIVNWPMTEYNKPDIATIAGDVNRNNDCKYAPGGLIAAKSSDENFPLAGGDACNAPNNPKYRYMSGTSMATPLATGIAADVIGYLKSKSVPYTTADVKALMMETADDLGQPAWEQGAGFVNGERLATTLEQRVDAGAASVGNVPAMLARQVPEFERWYLEKSGRITATPAGMIDKGTGHLINSAEQMDDIRKEAQLEIKGKSRWELLRLRLSYKLAS